MTAPNPLRCETCKNKSHDQPCPALDIVRKQYDREFGINHWWDIAHIVTSIVGCASHSSLQPKDGHCEHEWSGPSQCRACVEGFVSPCNTPVAGCPYYDKSNDTRRQPSAEQRIEKVIDEHWIEAQEEFMFVDDLTGKEVYGVRSEQLKSLLLGERE